MYRERMNSYYPPVIQAIREFKAIIDAECPEFEELDKFNEQVLADAYLPTMGEDRINEWEKLLSIQPLADSTLEDRRDTVIARIRAQGKLNTEMINTIVSTFTGGTANAWVENSVLYVEITPPPNNKSYRFENVEQELAKKVPAHLGLSVKRNYATWGEIKETCSTWADVKSTFNTWDDVLLFIKVVQEGVTIIEHPKDQSAPLGSIVTFKVVAVGEGLEYRWMYSRPTTTGWYETNLTGAKTAELTVEVTSGRNNYQYRCEVKDNKGNIVNSNPATLTVS